MRGRPWLNVRKSALMAFCSNLAMLEKFGVHTLPFLGVGSGAGTITKLDSTINSTESNFYSTTIDLPKEMALVLVLAQDCSDNPQQQTSTSRGGGIF